MEKTKKVFRSRISILLVAFILPIFVPLFKINDSKAFAVFILFVVLPTILILTGMRYVILNGKLYLKMWFISNGSVNIADIISVERSYNPLSSPAASLKRLRISSKKGAKYPYILISPVREKEFIEELKAVNPDIYVRVPDKKGIWRIWDWDL